MRTQFTSTILKIAETAGIKQNNKKTNMGNDPPWFNWECRELKNKIRKQGKIVKREPYNAGARTKLFEEKKKFKNFIKKKKREYKEGILQDMTLNRKNGRIFWKLLDKIDLKKNDKDFVKNIPMNRWVEHFKKVLKGNNDPNYPQDCTDIGPLDYEITLEELNESSYILKNGKACGIDCVSNEMLSCIMEISPDVLLCLFNAFLEGKAPDTHMSMLVPIHKKGSKTNTEFYRGVFLICSLSKMYAALLNKRLLKFVTENNILSQEQLGFIPGNRTSDAHIIIHNLVKQYCHKKKKMLYSCFVDFKKAFDSIPRDKLFDKLKRYGITGKFFNSIKNMYINDSCKIKIDGCLSEEINPNQGVRQGCVLSPLLFNIFMADFPNIFNSMEDSPPSIDGVNKLCCLLWADDLILFSESEHGLNSMLDKLSKYNEQNGLELNLEKTKCMTFNKTGRLIRRVFKYRGTTVETVREYKYLGFLITPSGEITSALHDLKDRAGKALFKLKTKMGDMFKKHVSTTLQLFDALIKPILMYMSDFWGCLKMPKNNPIETFQNRFLKQLLGVQVQTTNIGVLLETGRVPLTIYAKKNCIKNWNRINRNKCNSMLRYSYQNAVINDLVWCIRIKQELACVGLSELFLNMEGSMATAGNTMFKRLVDIFHQETFAEINNPNSKLRTYSLMKTKIGYESYLSQITSVTNRISLTKFRLSNHSLMIEKGRHLGIHKNARFCKFCEHEIEDEIHFLINCKTFAIIREKLFDIANNGIYYFYHLSDPAKLVALLSNPFIIQYTSEYLHKAQETRTNELMDPRTNERRKTKKTKKLLKILSYRT